MTHYRIIDIYKGKTIISEYWDDLEIFTYCVFAQYHGGSIQGFLEENKVLRTPNWEQLEEFNRRHDILDF